MGGGAPGTNRVEVLALSAAFTAAAAAALLLLPVATRPGAPGSGWWTAPALMPGLALAILLLANLAALVRAAAALRRPPLSSAETRAALRAMADWLRPLEFFLYFGLYIWALGRIGYFLATALFLLGLLLRAGLRSPRWLLAGLLTALALTAIFRWGLGIWVPPADLYGLFPPGVRKLLMRWA